MIFRISKKYIPQSNLNRHKTLPKNYQDESAALVMTPKLIGQAPNKQLVTQDNVISHSSSKKFL